MAHTSPWLVDGSFEIFERRVATHGARVAARCGREVLSYPDLAARVSSLAGWFRREGVQPGVTVGLAASRGLNFLTAVLAIMRTGAVYLPLILPGHMVPSVVMTLESLPIFASLLPARTVYPTVTFFDLGGHSRLVTQLLAAVRDAYRVNVGLQEFLLDPTARALASIVREHHQAFAPLSDRLRSSSLFTLHRNPGSAIPMFALPGALGFASAFAQISAHITARSCYALETRSLLSDSDHEKLALDALIEDCARTIAETADGPAIHLVGHSFGGRLGIHLVGPLHSRGVRVASLALLDPPDPDACAMEPDRDRKDKLRAFLWHIVRFFPPNVSQRAGELFGSVEPVSEKIILAEAERLIDPAGAALLGIDCPVLLLTAVNNPSELTAEPAASWARYLPTSVVHRKVVASHEGMLRHPHARPLAIELTQFFARYDRDIPASPREK